MADENQPVYAVYYPDNLITSPRNFYSTVKEAAKFANSPEAKSHGGARFKRFGTPREALSFLQGGALDSPIVDNSNGSNVPTEPPIPFKSVSRIEMNKLKQIVEKGPYEEFIRLVDENPRYIVNTSGDTPAIIAEGCRYNVLHIACKVGALEVVEKVLNSIADVEFMVRLYGTSKEDVLDRMNNIKIGYLNTPYKGNLDTPLHVAAKCGHVDVVKRLLAEPICDKNLINRDGKTPLEEFYLRYPNNGAFTRRSEMILLFTGLYVPLYRTVDNSAPAKVLPPTDYPRQLWSPDIANDSLKPINSEYKLAAFAGPFESSDSATQFYKEWLHSENQVKRSDMDKGFERVGRDLSSKNGVPWMESWFFLDTLCDITSHEGLRKLEEYLRMMRRTGGRGIGENEELNDVRTRLCFDDSDSEEEEGNEPENSNSLKHKWGPSGDVAADDEDDFCDANDSFLDDSLMGIVESLEKFRIQSPIRPNEFSSDLELGEDEEVDELAKLVAESNLAEFDDDDDDDYGTPPVTPEPVYILDVPSKVDNDLFLALSAIPAANMSNYSEVKSFLRKMTNLPKNAREEWPGKDSPRIKRVRSAGR